MRKIQVNPVLRAVGVIGSVAVLVSGVTFAAMQQSSATLTENTISSGTAELLVDGPDSGVTATASEIGFKFTGLIPGGDFSPKSTSGTPTINKQFRLENSGDVPLDVSVKASAITGSLDKTKIKIRFTNFTKELLPPVDYSLADLESGAKSLPGVSGTGFLGTSTSDEKNTFDIQVKLEAGAVTNGTGGSIDAFNLVFTGTNHAEANL